MQKIPWPKEKINDFKHLYDDGICSKCGHSKVYAEHFKIACTGRELNSRIETGAIQFGDDWPGIFIRGDNALHFGVTLHTLFDVIEHNDIEQIDPITCVILKGLADLLMSCDNAQVDNG